VNAALAVVGDGDLAASPLGLVAAAAITVAVEFAIVRGGAGGWRAPAAADGSRPVTT
jgi:hypothetical protein